MRSFLRLVAAVAVAFLALALLALGIVYLKWGRGPDIEKNSILVQSLSGPMPEYPHGGFTSGLFAPSAPTLHGVLGNLAKATVDDRVTGVLLVLQSSASGLAALEELRGAIAQVREAGKPVWAWSAQVGMRDLYLASACDSFFVQPGAYIEAPGMYSERFYVAEMLGKLGIEPNITRIESYKSAAELVLRTEMSPEAREMVGWILDDLYPRILAETSEGFDVPVSVLERAMAQVTLQAEELADLGLAHGLRYWDEMKEALPRPKGKDDPRLLQGGDYAEIDPADVGLEGKKTIAVVHAQGMIAGAKSGRDPFLGTIMGWHSVNQDLQRALDDEDVAAVVFRIDSSGGEALTSERIARMVEVVDAEKPVVVSMADVAASGGYHIAYVARHLVADANTITGSIGSITGKMNMRGLYNRLGITKDGLGRGPHPDFYSDYRNWTAEEMDIVREDHWESYDRWIADIAEHRDMTVAEIDSLARGRVWTGRQALDHGLIDAVGDLEAAVAEAKKQAGIEADEKVTLVHYPQPSGLLAQLLGTELSAAPQAFIGLWLGDRLDLWSSLQTGRWELLEVPVP